MTANIDFEKWWCCLNEIESNMIEFCLPHFLFMGSYITRSAFDLAWLVIEGHPGDGRYDAFVAMYGLTLTTIEIDGEEVEVYTPDLDWWALMYAFSLTEPFICTQRCFILRYSDIT